MISTSAHYLHQPQSDWTTNRRTAQALYQVCLELRDNRTRDREVRSLTTAMQETGMNHGTIVSIDTEERIETDAGVIDVIPAWLWSLQHLEN